MEKISLKPSVKELVYKSDKDSGSHFNVSYYQGTTATEKNLGSLVVLSSVKCQEDDLAYMVSLISSLAKREYFSQQSVQEQNPKTSFERTLQKLNEILTDFFKNKKFQLNVGLAAISSENIYLSKLGKLKVALARNGEYIDILNNIELFNKDTEDKEKFSNIISGKVQPNDKIFAYFPTRPITSREKLLNPLLVSQDQEEFTGKIAQLAMNSNNFSLCGVHINIKKIKEIPVELSRPVSIKTAYVSNEELDEDKKADSAKNKTIETSSSMIPVISSELSVGKRENIFTVILSNLKKLKNTDKLSKKARIRSFAVLALIVIAPLVVIFVLRSGPSGQDKAAVSQARESLKLAKSKITQKDQRSARSLLYAALSGVVNINKNSDSIKSDIKSVITSIDKVSEKQPELFFDTNQSGDKIVKIGLAGNQLYGLTENNKLFSIIYNSAQELTILKSGLDYIFGDDKTLAGLNPSFSVVIISHKTGNEEVKDARLKAVRDYSFYENNLYILSENKIFKISDITNKQLRTANWTDDNQNGELTSLTVDGDIYALNAEGKIIKYFKGKKTGELDIQFPSNPQSKIVTFKDFPNIYLADKTNGKVLIFDKSNGDLKTSFDFGKLGKISDIQINSAGNIFILSSDNKIWQIGK